MNSSFYAVPEERTVRRWVEQTPAGFVFDYGDELLTQLGPALELGRWTYVAPLGYLNAPKWSGKSLVADPERAPLVCRV